MHICQECWSRRSKNVVKRSSSSSLVISWDPPGLRSNFASSCTFCLPFIRIWWDLYKVLIYMVIYLISWSSKCFGVEWFVYVKINLFKTGHQVDKEGDTSLLQYWKLKNVIIYYKISLLLPNCAKKIKKIRKTESQNYIVLWHW